MTQYILLVPTRVKLKQINLQYNNRDFPFLNKYDRKDHKDVKRVADIGIQKIFI